MDLGPFVVEQSGESISGRAPEVSLRLLRELRGGELPVGGRLDLHGRTRDEAVRGVARFVALARERGARTVLVIHGRGHNSEPGGAVLRPAVWAWLASAASARAGVMAFVSARPRDGGGGATLVLLRR